MAESQLESYFDSYIANDAPRTKQEEKGEAPGEEVFFTLLPDELLTQTDHGEADVPPVPPTLTPKVDMQPQIRNVISTVRLGCHLDLDLIARTCWNVMYSPKTFKALTMRIRKPQATAVIHKSGNLVCVGAKRKEESRLAARRFARILQKLGFPVRFLGFKIQNLMGTCKTAPLNLERLALAHQQHCSYEPELFPGLFYRVAPGITATLFASGRVNLAGAKEEAEVYESFDTISQILSSFQRR